MDKRLKKIKLTQNKYSLVDSKKFKFINQYKWCLSYTSSTHYYAKRDNKEGKTEYLHWYIVGKPPLGLMVDHINGNTLDNRRKNLRIVNARKNAQNRTYHRLGKLAGVSFDSKCNRWRARVSLNGKVKSLGRYKSKYIAHKVYVKYLEK